MTQQNDNDIRAILVKGFPEAQTELAQLPAIAANAEHVVIDSDYSALNYKDMLAVTGKGKIMRSYPMVAGIDVAGRVREDTAGYQVGDAVFCAGSGMGENFDGGLSEQVALPLDAVVRLPAAWTAKHAMLLGTAGLSAALAIYKLQQAGVTPDMGKIVVTGATGGVGLWAIRMLAHLGYESVAVSRDPSQSEADLKAAGATELLSVDDLVADYRPLAKAKYAGGIDQLGGEPLAALLSQIDLHGAVASIGLAASHKLEMTVMPFILRGVSLIGINSPSITPTMRQTVWDWTADNFDAAFIESMPHSEVALDEVISVCEDWSNRGFGRVVVRISD